MKVSALREMTRDELLQKRHDLDDELFNLTMRTSFKALDNPLRLRSIRRDSARILTVLREDELGFRKLAESGTSIIPQTDTGSNEKGE